MQPLRRPFIIPVLCSLACMAALGAAEVGASQTIHVVEPNEFHVDGAAESLSGTATVTDSYGNKTTSTYKANGERVQIGYLRQSESEGAVAFLGGLDLTIAGSAQTQSGFTTTLFTAGVDGSLGLRLGASHESPMFLDILGQVGVAITSLSGKGNGVTMSGSLGHFNGGGSVRPGVRIGQSMGIYGLVGVEATSDNGTVTMTMTGFGNASATYNLSASGTYFGVGIFANW